MMAMMPVVGILSGTKMVDAIADSVIAAIPDWMGPYLAIVTGALSIPFTFFISNDAFYFGIVPILAKAAAVAGEASSGPPSRLAASANCQCAPAPGTG